MQRPDSGFSLPELLVTVSVLGLLASLALAGGQRSLARMRVETTSRRLGWGLEQARRQAQILGQPCALELGPSGWRQPSGGSLPGCGEADVELQPHEATGVVIGSNLPGALRFSSNGLVLDGGTAVLSASGTTVQRCLVMALPLGITRMGRYRSSSCEPDPSL